MKQFSNIVSLSGGKDSTAMLLMLLEHGESVADVMFFDTGWEFPEMYEHLDKLEAFTGLKITRLRPRLPVDVETDKSPFDWMFSEYPVARRGTRQVHMAGRGWPNAPVRWCTGRKQDALKAHLLALTHQSGLELPLRQCIGFAADERHRLDGVRTASTAYNGIRWWNGASRRPTRWLTATNAASPGADCTISSVASVASAVLCSLLMNCGHFAVTSLTCGNGCSSWNPGCRKTDGASRIPASPRWMPALPPRRTCNG